MGYWHRSVESVVVRLARVDPTFWRGRKVLVTGHTGFKGAWLCYWLTRMGARVVGLALPPSTNPNLFSEAAIGSRVESLIVDIRDLQATRRAIVGAKPEIVFHLAAQPLVLRSYKAPVETFSTNVLGTVHVLESLRDLSDVTVAVMITTDKVYANREWVYPYREEDPLGGHDPYSASKAACEIVISSYRSSFLREQGVAVASARAGNVIGGGDWSADRLIPDIARAWERGDYVRIRRPDSVRPWQHVLEPLCGYLVLAERLAANSNLADAYNMGPEGQDFAPFARSSNAPGEPTPTLAWSSTPIPRPRMKRGFFRLKSPKRKRRSAWLRAGVSAKPSNGRWSGIALSMPARREARFAKATSKPFWVRREWRLQRRRDGASGSLHDRARPARRSSRFSVKAVLR
jgi:CDP-glucose 4,6-dehydratase